MRGSEAIQILGEKLYEGFTIDVEPRRTIYKQAYENFITGLEENNKGLAIIGQVGVGKTAMMKIMQKLFKETPRAFKWLRCPDVMDLLEDYSPSEVKQMYGRDLKMDLYIDDSGFGSPTHNKYGNVTNIISDILYERSELFVNEKIKTHISSNKPTVVDKEKYPNATSLEDWYGLRVVDRILEMCEIIVWKGESLRKDNAAK